MTAFEDLCIYPSTELFFIKSLMMGEGIYPRKWLFGTGLYEEDAFKKDAKLSIRQFNIIYNNIYRLSEKKDIGLQLGRALNISCWGPASTALMFSTSIEKALMIAAKYRTLVKGLFSFTPIYRVDENHYAIDFTAEGLLSADRTFITEVMVAFLHRTLSDLCGSDKPISEVRMDFACPEYFNQYERVLACPVKFGCERRSVVFKREHLKCLLPLSNPIAEQQALDVCEMEVERLKGVKSGDVVLVLRSELNRCEGPLPRIENIAESLSTTPRTLRRRLKEMGTSYSKICQEHQMNLALSQLHDPGKDLRTIAFECGFVGVSGFREAFKRWTGVTPTRHRQMLISQEKVSPGTMHRV